MANEPPYNELVALLRRNEERERLAADAESDMRRLLLLARDAQQRSQLVQAQGVRRITLIAKASTHAATQSLCAGILGNLAHSERGRLSASSCDRWQCISHRHNCPLSMLVGNMQAGADGSLRRVSGAALLAFSIQNECQVQLDTLAAIPVLLKLLDAKKHDDVATELAVYAAGVLWNMCKAPALLLKLETIYGTLKDQLTRKLSNLLLTPLEPFELFLTPTGERGMPALLDFEGENLNLMLTTSISSQLTIVLAIESYVGRTRSLVDQFRTQTPQTKAGASGARSSRGSSNSGKSLAHYDESGALASRTCAVCAKAIRMRRKTSRHTRQRFLLCAKDGCGQTYHLACSRWASLNEELLGEVDTTGTVDSDVRFYCDVCVLQTPLGYLDFLAAHPDHEKLLTANLFSSTGAKRVPIEAPLAVQSDVGSNTSRHTSTQQPDQDVAPADEKEDYSPWPAVMLFDRNGVLVGVGDKRFSIAASSRDPEMFVVAVTYVTTRVYPATHQVRAIPSAKDSAAAAETPFSCDWDVSYARPGALDIPVAPGSAVFWPAPSTRDVRALGYTRRSLEQLEAACLYEFQGEQPHEKLFSIGSASSQPVSSLAANTDAGLWMALHPRKGICMKLLAAQIGHAKRLREVEQLQTNTGVKPLTKKAGRKPRKPHFPRQQLNRVAVDAGV